MNDEVRDFSQIVNTVFKNIKVSDVQNSVKTIDVWQKILLRIKSADNPNEGENLAIHSRVIDFKNGVLFVEADHPGWIELLQLHKKYILKGLKIENPGLKVETIAFVLKGKKADVIDFEKTKSTNENLKNTMQKQYDEEEKNLEKAGFASFQNETAEKKKLPEKLASLFDDLKQTMLTNSENK